MKSSSSPTTYRPRVSRKVQRYVVLFLITMTSLLILIYVGKDNRMYDRAFNFGVYYFGESADVDRPTSVSISRASGVMANTHKEKGPDNDRLNYLQLTNLQNDPKTSINYVTQYNERESEKLDYDSDNIATEGVHNSMETTSYNNDENDENQNNDEFVTVKQIPVTEIQQGKYNIANSVEKSEVIQSDILREASNKRVVLENGQNINEGKVIGTQKLQKTNISKGTQDTEWRTVEDNSSEDDSTREAGTIKDDVGNTINGVISNMNEVNSNKDDVSSTVVDVGNPREELGYIRDERNNTGVDEAENNRGEVENRDEVNTEDNKTIMDDRTGDSITKIADMNDNETQNGGNDGNMKKEESPTQVLLVTYLRSGSTLTADIIQQVPGVFYTYEPLKPYLQSHTVKRPEDMGYFSVNGICSIFNLTCRNASQKSEGREVILNDIVRYYNCDLDHFTRPFLWSPFGTAVRQYKECVKASAKFKTSKAFCLKQCTSSAKSLKTIRLSMDMVEILMKRLKNLKVIHLLRDPRGMIKSRKTGGFVKKWMNITEVAESVCKRFERDIEIATELRLRYPGRLKTYLYEQIAEHPKLASASLFKFLGLIPSESFATWLYNHTAAGNQSSFYGTSRPNSTITANAWRKVLPFNDVIKIDNECSTYYKYTGILKAHSAKVLKDMNIPLRSRSPVYGDFL